MGSKIPSMAIQPQWCIDVEPVEHEESPCSPSFPITSPRHGHAAFDAGATVEYFCPSQKDWVRATICGKSISAESISYEIVMKDFRGIDFFQSVSFEQLRRPLVTDETCWVFSTADHRWLQAVIRNEVVVNETVVHYKVRVASDIIPHVQPKLLRRRFPEGSLVHAYLGLQAGWVKATVAFEYEPRLQVSIVGATNLVLDSGPDDTLWCQCEIRTTERHSLLPSDVNRQLCCKTGSPAWDADTGDPTWDETHEMFPWCVDDALEFTIYCKSQVLGTCTLASDRLHPHGFSGAIPIIGPCDATLHVRVEFIGETLFEPLRWTKVRLDTKGGKESGLGGLTALEGDIDSYRVVLRPEGRQTEQSDGEKCQSDGVARANVHAFSIFDSCQSCTSGVDPHSSDSQGQHSIRGHSFAERVPGLPISPLTTRSARRTWA